MNIKNKIHTKLTTINDSIVSNLIFTFIKENNISYSENKNGIFFNVSLLNDKLASELLEYINIISKTNNISEIDQIIVPEKKKPMPKKKKENKKYKDCEINTLESTILSFSFQ
jgi:hypothetical protein